jgi:hypothetical protein
MTNKALVGGADETRKRVGWLCGVLALEALLVVGHFVHGAHVYEDPSRYHVVLPTVVALVGSFLVGGHLMRRPSRAALWGFAIVIAVPFVGLFGLYHGGFNHTLKLAMYTAGTPPERLEELFDSPDFAVPNDVVFEVTGVSTLVVAVVVAWMLVRLVRTPLDERPTTAGSKRSPAAGGA